MSKALVVDENTVDLDVFALLQFVMASNAESRLRWVFHQALRQELIVVLLGSSHDAIVSNQSGGEMWRMESPCRNTPVSVCSGNQETSFPFGNDARVLIIVLAINGCAQLNGALKPVAACSTVMEKMFGVGAGHSRSSVDLPLNGRTMLFVLQRWHVSGDMLDADVFG